jgi:hypothetical protein
MRRIVGVTVCLVSVLAVQGALAQSLDPIATPLTGNINLTNSDPPETNIDCGLWSELHDQTYVGTLDVNDPRFDGTTVLMLLYIGGGSGTGLITGPVRLLDDSGLIGRGILAATTDGHVPPDREVHAAGFADLRLLSNGQRTGEHLLLVLSMTVSGGSIAGNVDGGIGSFRSVVWNGEKCPVSG